MTLEGSACTVAILAGGMGTRLKSRTGAIPKPMALVCGKPVLEHLINLCATHGFLTIALLVHHEHQVISDYFGDGSNWGVRLTYCIEQEARGTAGALNDALPVLAERFLVLYGDTYADVDLNRIWSWHHTRKADATLFLHPNDHPADSDIVELDPDGSVTAIHPYPHEPSLVFRNLVNAALYVFERAALVDSLPTAGKADIAKHTLNALLAKGSRVVGYVSPEYIKDMGTPDRLDKVERDVREGMAARLSGRGLRTAIFLDRDGTINVEVSHLSSPDQLTLIPGAGEAIRAINRSGALAVVVTNQPVLARGDVDWRGMEAIHAQLDKLLGEEGAYIDRLYLCPHHPDTGFEGEVLSLKKICECRKPASGLIEQAVADLGIAIQQSWMIGDSTADIVAGNNIGLQTILVRTGNAGKDGKYTCTPDFVVSDIKAAVSRILNGRD
jgi:histidinol-phosphate phosphatase family protein